MRTARGAEVAAQESSVRGGVVRRAPEATAGNPSVQSLLHLQRSAGNRAVAGLVDGPAPVQRVKDGFGVVLPDKDLGLAPAFKAKHVAADEAAARVVTDNRYTSNKMPPAMAAGRIPNTVATEAGWKAALAASPTQVDTENAAWTRGVSLRVAEVWQVRWSPPRRKQTEGKYTVTKVANAALSAGGYAAAEYREGGRKGGAREVTGGQFLVDHVEKETD